MEYGRGALHTEFPIGNSRLGELLLSIGIQEENIPARGNDVYKVTLEASDEAGAEILSWLEGEEGLQDVNLAARLVSKICPYGYREFLDMVHPSEEGTYSFYRKFDRKSPTKNTGLEGFYDELARYHAMMEEYERVCEEDIAAEEEEQDGPEQ